MNKWFALIVISALLLAGCNKKEEKGVISSAHASMEKGVQNLNNERNVVVSDEAASRWKAVTLFIENRTAKTTAEQIVEIGSAYLVPNTNITIKVLTFLPDFKMDDKQIFSPSNNPNNPAVQVIIQEPGKADWKGWLYAKHPDVHAFAHEKVGLLLVAGVPK